MIAVELQSTAIMDDPDGVRIEVDLSATSFEEDEHEEGEEEVEFFAGGHVAELVDLEAAFPEGGLLGQAHGGGAVAAGCEILGVAEVAC